VIGRRGRRDARAPGRRSQTEGLDTLLGKQCFSSRDERQDLRLARSRFAGCP
jgi:hypothetical protein